MSPTFKAIAVKKLREAGHPCNWLTESGRADENGMFRLEWFPIMVGSATGTIAGNFVYDTGDGTLKARLPNGTERWAGHINYLSGWVNLAPHGANCEYRLRYFYYQEHPEPAQVVRVETARISARPRRLTQAWTAEFLQ